MYIKIKEKQKYLYRAVDSEGNTLDFLLTAKRDTEAAKRFFCKTLKALPTNSPQIITVDKNAVYLKAYQQKKELPKKVKLRQKKYLNNIVLARSSRYKTISQTRDGICVIQHSSTHVKGIRGYEHGEKGTSSGSCQGSGY